MVLLEKTYIIVSVDITQLDDDIDVQINPSDLKIDTYRASGAGGVCKYNRFCCQNNSYTYRSNCSVSKWKISVIKQRDSYENAKGKLIHLKELEQKERIEDIQSKYSQITWGVKLDPMFSTL